MTIRRDVVIKQARDIFYFAILCSVQTYFICPHCEGFRDYSRTWYFCFALWIVLWKGNSLLGDYINRKISWIHFPLKRLLVGMVSTIAFTLSAVLVMIVIFENLFHFNFGSTYHFTIYLSIAITILIAIILHSRSFLLHWRQAALDAAKYEKESMAMRYESLKNQVNPHFLFNSLNALTNLVYEDPDKAVRFIKQLSEVYRYVLDSRNRELVSLQEEVKFLESYLYLQKIRFGSKLNIDMKVTNDRVMVAPLALQMLIENAIKHNIVSEEDPLTVQLYQDNGYIVVENNLQRKMVSPEPSSGVGLENIRKRYEFLGDRKVEVRSDERSFVVKLPALTSPV